MTEFGKVSRLVEGLVDRIKGVARCMAAEEWHTAAGDEVQHAWDEWAANNGRERVGKIVAKLDAGGYGETMGKKVAGLKETVEFFEATLAKLRKWVQAETAKARGTDVGGTGVARAPPPLATPGYLKGWRLALSPSEAAFAPVRFIPAPAEVGAAAVTPQTAGGNSSSKPTRAPTAAFSPLARTYKDTPVAFSMKKQPPPPLGCLKGVDVSLVRVDPFERSGRDLPALHHGTLFIRGPRYTPYHGRYWTATVDLLKNEVACVGDFKGLVDPRRPAVPPYPLQPFAAHLDRLMRRGQPPSREALVRLKVGDDEYAENVELLARFRAAALAVSKKYDMPRDVMGAVEQFLLPGGLVVWVPEV